MIGQWVNEYYPNPHRKTLDRANRRYVARFVTDADGAEVVELDDRGAFRDILDIEVKVVCADCNHGWMSILEQSMSDVFPALLSGKLRITHSTAETFTRWAIKTAIVWDWTHPRSATASLSQRLDLRAGKPVAGVVVRFGRRDFIFAQSICLNALGLFVGESSVPSFSADVAPDIKVTIIALGPLVAVVALGDGMPVDVLDDLLASDGFPLRRLEPRMLWTRDFDLMSASEFERMMQEIGSTRAGGRPPPDPNTYYK